LGGTKLARNKPAYRFGSGFRSSATDGRSGRRAPLTTTAANGLRRDDLGVRFATTIRT
jgi:hypothetical protein